MLELEAQIMQLQELAKKEAIDEQAREAKAAAAKLQGSQAKKRQKKQNCEQGEVEKQPKTSETPLTASKRPPLCEIDTNEQALSLFARVTEKEMHEDNGATAHQLGKPTATIAANNTKEQLGKSMDMEQEAIVNNNTLLGTMNPELGEIIGLTGATVAESDDSGTGCVHCSTPTVALVLLERSTVKQYLAPKAKQTLAKGLKISHCLGPCAVTGHLLKAGIYYCRGCEDFIDKNVDSTRLISWQCAPCYQSQALAKDDESGVRTSRRNKRKKVYAV